MKINKSMYYLQEKILKKISITIIILGILSLFLISQEISTNVTDKIDEMQIEQNVKIQGIVQKYTPKEKVIFLEIDAITYLPQKVVLFSDENIYVKKGDIVELEGYVEEYQGQKEIIANKITIK
jgi:DNA/RNA endonuclease YhcR with UshA esterase domain